MGELRSRRHGALCALCAVLALSSCKCEDKIRRALSDKGDRAVIAQDASKSSTPRDVEPNERPEAATPIRLTEELRAIQGELDSAEDVDWFALSHGGEQAWLLEVIVEPREPTLDLALELALEGQASGAVYQLAGPGQPESIPLVALEGSPLKLAVRSRGGHGAYTMRFVRRISGGAVEAEPNDVARMAWPFEVPGEIQGLYDRPGDRDVFIVRLPPIAADGGDGGDGPRDDAQGVYTVQVSGLEELPQSLELMTSIEQQVAWMSLLVPAGQAAEIPNLRPDVSTLWLALSAGQGASREQAYRLKWLAHPPLPPGQRLEAEPNDEPAQAMSLPPRDAQVRGYLHHAQDRDVMRLELGASSEPAQLPSPAAQPSPQASPSKTPKRDEIDLFAPPTQDVGQDVGQATDQATDQAERPAPLTLPPWPVKSPAPYVVDLIVSPQHPTLVPKVTWLSGPLGGQSAQSPGPKQPAVWCAQPLPAQPVELAISGERRAPLPAQHVGPDYLLQTRVRSPKADEEIEPNDARQQADPLRPGSPVQGMISREADVDFFVVDLPEAPLKPDAQGLWQHRVEVSLQAHPLNLKLTIYDEDGVALTSPEGLNASGAGGAERFTGDWPAGRYFVAVSATQGALCEPYTLAVSLAQAP